MPAGGLGPADRWVTAARRDRVTGRPWLAPDRVAAVSKGVRRLPIITGSRPHRWGVRSPCSLLIMLIVGCADPGADGRCATERDCPAAQRCLDGICASPAACALDTECPARQICVDRRCAAQSCRGDADCPDRRCVAGWCRPPAAPICAEDADCASGVCDRASMLCLLDTCPASGCAAGCAADGQCPAEMWCAADGVCRLGCRAGGCGAGLCDPETRRCAMLGCTVDEQCPAGAFCDGGACAPGCRLAPDDCPGGRCDRATRRCGCTIDVDCAEDGFCAEDGVCRPGCRLGGCPGGACDPVARTCAPRPCARDGDCPPAQACGLDDGICRDARGPLPVESPCAVDDACASGRCRDGVCAGRCAVDADCPAGRCALVGEVLMCSPPPIPCTAAADCPAGACRIGPERPLALGCFEPVGEAAGGAPCDADGQCESGVCLDGGCWIPCAGDADCPGACLPDRVRVLDDRGSPEPEDDRAAGFPGCLDPADGSGARCASDVDCPPEEACGLWPTADERGFEGRCRVPPGPGLGGEGCAVDADCRGRWCAAERCVAPCAGELDPGCAAPCAEARIRARGDLPDVRAIVRVCGGR